LLVKD
ncbi:DUF4371 domain-containing protein, partial [Cephalotus follicularis]